METEYLKHQNDGQQRKEVHVGEKVIDKKTISNKESEETVTKVKAELQTALAKIENIKLEKQKLSDRISFAINIIQIIERLLQLKSSKKRMQYSSIPDFVEW